MSEPERSAPGDPRELPETLESLEQQLPPERIPGRERFRRSARLRSSQDFQRVRRRGRSLGGALLALGYARQDVPAAREQIPATRIGISVSKRVGKAVVRNLVKRRVRESIRRRLSRLAPGWDIVITARPAAASATYGELDVELAQLLERARLVAREPRRAGRRTGSHAGQASELAERRADTGPGSRPGSD